MDYPKGVRESSGPIESSDLRYREEVLYRSSFFIVASYLLYSYLLP